MLGVLFDRTVSFADRTQRKVVGPAHQLAIDLRHQFLGIPPRRSTVGALVNRLDDPFEALLRRPRAQIGSSRFFRVTSPELVAQKVEPFVRYAADACFRLV